MEGLQLNHQKSYAPPILSFGRKNVSHSVVSSTKIIYILQTHEKEEKELT